MPYPVGWVGSQIDGAGIHSAASTWTIATTNVARPRIGVTQKLGVMFLESALPQGTTTRIPWNVNSTLSGISDGASSTILMRERLGRRQHGQLLLSELNRPTGPARCRRSRCSSARPMSAARTVQLDRDLDCTAGGVLAATSRSFSHPPVTGRAGWHLPTRSGRSRTSTVAGRLTIEGGYPFSNSGHPGGCNMGFCDGGVRFISNTIDGTVYSKMITPAGSKLPYCKQLPVNQDSFAN